jgi:PST family polysaccharide transporter
VPEHFGLIAMVTAVTTVAERFKDLGLSMATVQSLELTNAEASSLFWINAGFGIAVAVGLVALSLPIAHFFGEPRLGLITTVLAATFLFGGLSVQHQALLRRHMRFGRLAAVQLGSSLISVAVAIALALADYGYWALVAREVVRSACLAAGSWAALPWRPLHPSRGADVRRHMRFGSNIAAFNLLWFFVYNLDQIVIGRLFGAHTLGIYRQGVQLVLGPIYQIIGPINSVAETALSRLQSDREGYRRYYMRILNAFTLVSLPIAAIVTVFAEEIILVLMGVQWLPAAEFVRIFAIVAFIRPAASTVGFVMTTQGRSGRYLAWGCLSAVALVTCVLVGSMWGPRGIALGHLVAAYAFGIPLLLFGFKGSPVGMRQFLEAIWRPLVASSAVAVALLLVHQQLQGELPPLGRLALGAPAGIALYLLLLVVLPGGRREIAALGHALRMRRDALPGDPS